MDAIIYLCHDIWHKYVSFIICVMHLLHFLPSPLLKDAHDK